jgi:hypothetical protein
LNITKGFSNAPERSVRNTQCLGLHHSKVVQLSRNNNPENAEVDKKQQYLMVLLLLMQVCSFSS